jgi:hypothetical protein
MHTQTDIQHGDLTNLLLFLQIKESRLKKRNLEKLDFGGGGMDSSGLILGPATGIFECSKGLCVPLKCCVIS